MGESSRGNKERETRFSNRNGRSMLLAGKPKACNSSCFTRKET